MALSSKDDTISLKASKVKSSSLTADIVQEVQETIINDFGDISGKGITSDLIEKISQNPCLVEGLTNPRYMAALEYFQKNPQQAMIKFQDHPDIIEYLKRICSVIGEHFLELGKQEENRKEKFRDFEKNIGPLAKNALKRESERQAFGFKSWDKSIMKEDKDKIESIMANDEITQLLMDPDLQRVMQECQTPSRMSLYMSHPIYGQKLRTLINAGLLQMAH